MNAYLVTVTPKITTYAGTSVFGQYSEVVRAKTRADAISRVRRARRDEDGSQTIPATFTAREATEADIAESYFGSEY